MAESIVEVFIDGASSGNPGPAGVGVVFLDAHGQPAATFKHYVGEATNNVAEYLALIYALQEAQARGWRRLAVKTDSELLARQLAGAYKVRDGTLRILHDVVQHARHAFEQVSVQHVSRTLNQEADRLARQAVRSQSAI